MRGVGSSEGKRLHEGAKFIGCGRQKKLCRALSEGSRLNEIGQLWQRGG
jgi:hypothetical protein